MDQHREWGQCRVFIACSTGRYVAAPLKRPTGTGQGLPPLSRGCAPRPFRRAPSGLSRSFLSLTCPFEHLQMFTGGPSRPRHPRAGRPHRAARRYPPCVSSIWSSSSRMMKPEMLPQPEALTSMAIRRCSLPSMYTVFHSEDLGSGNQKLPLVFFRGCHFRRPGLPFTARRIHRRFRVRCHQGGQ